MSVQDQSPRLAAAAAELAGHGHCHDAGQVVAGLADGLSLLRELFFERMHGDVERIIGYDSMLLGASAVRSEADTHIEIEIYEVVEAAAEAAAGQFTSDDEWFCHWLARLRLGMAADKPAIAQRFSFYVGKPPDVRRRTFLGTAAAAVSRIGPCAAGDLSAVSAGRRRVNRSCLRRLESRGEVAAAADLLAPLHRRLPDLSRPPAGKRREVSAMRQSLLALRVAYRGVDPAWPARNLAIGPRNWDQWLRRFLLHF